MTAFKQDDHNQLKWKVMAGKIFQSPAYFQRSYHTFKLFLTFCFLTLQILILLYRVCCSPISYPRKLTYLRILKGRKNSQELLIAFILFRIEPIPV